MRFAALLALPVLVLCADNNTKNLDNVTTLFGSTPPETRYGFYRKMTWGQELLRSHRLFDGVTENLTEFPAACVLLNEHFSPRCSAAVVAPRWAVTTAHCTFLGVAFLIYNAQHPSSSEGNLVQVLYMYRHPK